MHYTVNMFCGTISILGGVVISLGNGDGAFLLFSSLFDCRFCLIYQRCPLVVVMDLGKYLRTNWEVSPGHVAKFCLSIAAHYVVCTGGTAALGSPVKYF